MVRAPLRGFCSTTAPQCVGHTKSGSEMTSSVSKGEAVNRDDRPARRWHHLAVRLASIAVSLVVTAGFGACQCGEQLNRLEADIDVAPESIDFSQAAVLRSTEA